MSTVSYFFYFWFFTLFPLFRQHFRISKRKSQHKKLLLIYSSGTDFSACHFFSSKGALAIPFFLVLLHPLLHLSFGPALGFYWDSWIEAQPLTFVWSGFRPKPTIWNLMGCVLNSTFPLKNNSDLADFVSCRHHSKSSCKLQFGLLNLHMGVTDSCFPVPKNTRTAYGCFPCHLICPFPNDVCTLDRFTKQEEN